jgi:hypothetical protein
MSTKGSLRKDERRGTWFFVVDLPPADGRRRQAFRRGFATKKAALDQLRLNVSNGLHVDRSTLTVDDYMTEHWLPAIASRVRPTTFDSYRRIVGAHIVPRLGGMQLQRLDRVTVGR